MNTLTLDDIDDSIASKIYTQDYSKKENIDGVKIIPLQNHPGEDGDFCELMRLNENSALVDMPTFKLSQINRSKLLPSSIKAWHAHFNQNEFWYISPSDHLLVGLWDIRKKSKTYSKTMRIVLGGSHSQLLFIPKGVAHGSSNISHTSVDLFYFVDQPFNFHNPDEKRIPWDVMGADFWLPKKD